MDADSGVTLDSLKVDGGMVHNDLLMQFQADLLGVPVIRPRGRRDDRARRRLRRRAGDRVLEQRGGPARELGRGQALGARRWTPTKRDAYYKDWKKAVTRTFDWVD